MTENAPTHSTPPRVLRVFLCHSSGDKNVVRNLYYRLFKDGIAPWLDEEDLLPGQDWAQEIPEVVRASDIVVVCLSRGSITKDGYVQKEIKFALDKADEKPEGTIYIIPVKLEECNVPRRLSRWQWVDLYQEGGYERLMRAFESLADELGAKMSRQEVVEKVEQEKRETVLRKALLAAQTYSEVKKVSYDIKAFHTEYQNHPRAIRLLEEVPDAMETVLRKALLAAQTYSEVKKVSYDIKAFHTECQNHPGAIRLLEEVQEALRRTPHPQAAPQAAPERLAMPMMRTPFILLLLGLLTLIFTFITGDLQRATKAVGSALKRIIIPPTPSPSPTATPTPSPSVTPNISLSITPPNPIADGKYTVRISTGLAGTAITIRVSGTDGYIKRFSGLTDPSGMYLQEIPCGRNGVKDEIVSEAFGQTVRKEIAFGR